MNPAFLRFTDPKIFAPSDACAADFDRAGARISKILAPKAAVGRKIGFLASNAFEFFL
jgi:hypothetical protein